MNDESRNFIAGSLAGFTTRFMTQPLDVIKIRFQLQVEPLRKQPGSYYWGVWQAMRRIFFEEQIYGLWKGHVPAQLLSMTYCGVQFVTYYGMEKWLSNKSTPTPIKSLSNDMIAGFVTAMACSIACQPLDMMRTRLIAQGQDKIYCSLFDGMRCVMRHEGILAFWRGLGPSLMTYVPQITVYMTCYEQFKRLYKKRLANRLEPVNEMAHFTPPWYFSLTAGGLSGLISKTIVYPLDLTKKRLEIRAFEQARISFGSAPKPHTIQSYKVLSFSQLRPQLFASVFILKDLLFTEGLPGMFKGWTPSALKAVTTTGLVFFWFEQFRWILDQI